LGLTAPSNSPASRPETLDGRQHARPFLFEKALALAAHELCPAALGDEHAPAAPFLDEAFVDELLVALEHGQRVQRELRGDTSDRRQCVTVGELTLQNHVHHLVAELAIDGLAVVPGRIHAAGRSGASLHYCSRTPGPHCPGTGSWLAVRSADIPAGRCTGARRQ
jgi:hypothetical protein